MNFEGDISVVVHLNRVGSNYDVKVSLEFTSILQCVKCLCEFPRESKVEFRISGSINDKGMIYDSESEAEYDEGFERPNHAKGLHGSKIDLSPAIAQEILMNLDSYPKCSDDCAGICVNCGEDLNKSQCKCDNKNLKGE